jgi:hypothetical protein
MSIAKHSFDTILIFVHDHTMPEHAISFLRANLACCPHQTWSHLPWRLKTEGTLFSIDISLRVCLGAWCLEKLVQLDMNLHSSSLPNNKFPITRRLALFDSDAVFQFVEM